jgi:hypothetical protein
VLRRSYLLFILLVVPQTLVRPIQSPIGILNGSELDMRTAQPSWRFGGGVCGTLPLINEEVGVRCGLWAVNADWFTGVVASVQVYEIATPGAVFRWMKNDARLELSSWIVTPCDLGVPAYLGTIQNSPRTEIIFGKERFIVMVSGDSKVNVDRVARSLLLQISN